VTKKPDYEAAYQTMRLRAESAATVMRSAATEIQRISRELFLNKELAFQLNAIAGRLTASADVLVAECAIGTKQTRRWALWLSAAALTSASAVGIGVAEAAGADIWGSAKALVAEAAENLHHVDGSMTEVEQASREIPDDVTRERIEELYQEVLNEVADFRKSMAGRLEREFPTVEVRALDPRAFLELVTDSSYSEARSDITAEATDFSARLEPLESWLREHPAPD
jgi:hypothetical protein